MRGEGFYGLVCGLPPAQNGQVSNELHVEILDGDQAGERHELSGICVVGRSADCTLQIAHPAISREHAMIRLEEGTGWVVEDLDSSQGTFVNDFRTRKAVLLDGDKIRVGPISLRVQTSKPHLDEVPPDEVEVVQSRFMPTTRLSLDVVKWRTSARYLTDGSDSGVVQAAAAEGAAASPPANQGTALVPDTGLSQSGETETERRLELMLQISASLAAIHQPDRLTRETAVRLSNLFPQARRIGFFRLEADSKSESGDSNVLRPTYLVDRARSQGDDKPVHVSQKVLQSAIDRRQAVLSEDVSADPRFSVSDSLSADGVVSIVCVPLCLGERVLGVIYMDTVDGTDPFDEGALRLVTGVAGLLAAAFENARLFAQVQNESIRRASLERYFSPDLVERVLKGDLPLAREGRLAEGTILFVDIRGFTRLTITTDPNVLVRTLNAYFAAMQRIIFRTRGTVERFGGDSILAYWGIVDQDPQGPRHGLRAALAMQIEVFRLNPELIRNQQPPIQIAVGLNTGEVVAGDVGSAERYEFTILGDAINMARRFEALAAAWEVIAGEATVIAAGKGVLHEPLPPTTVKGKEKPVQVSLVYGLAVGEVAAGKRSWELAVPGDLWLEGASAPQKTLAASIELGNEVVLEVLTADDPEPGTQVNVQLRLPRAQQTVRGIGRVLPAGVAETVMLMGGAPNLAVAGSGVQRIKLALLEPQPFLRYLGLIS